MQYIFHCTHSILAWDSKIGIDYCEIAKLEIHRYTTEILYTYSRCLDAVVKIKA